MLFKEKTDTFQCYIHSNKDPKLFNKVEYLQNEVFNQSYQRKVLFTFLEKNDEFFDQY